MGIVTGWDKWDMNKTITKIISTGEVQDRREENIPIN